MLAFADQPEKLPERLRTDHPTEKLAIGQERLASLRSTVDSLTGIAGKVGLAAEELLLGVDLSSHALSHGQSLLGESSPGDLPSVDELPARYEKLWLKRARPGGLPESRELLEKALARWQG